MVRNMEYKTEKELYTSLRGAFQVKLRMIKDKYDYIKMIDIWNYLKINKWQYSVDLTLADMVNDIIHTDNMEINDYKAKIKENIL